MLHVYRSNGKRVLWLMLPLRKAVYRIGEWHRAPGECSLYCDERKAVELGYGRLSAIDLVKTLNEWGWCEEGKFPTGLGHEASHRFIKLFRKLGEK